MDTASLVVSIAALVIAGYSMWYARHQANSARAVSRIEEDRRAEELLPDIDIAVEAVSDWHRLTLTLNSNFLEHCHVSVLDGSMTFTDSQEGVSRDEPDVADYSPLSDTPVARRVHLDGNASEARLRIDCTDPDGRHWRLIRTVPFPAVPQIRWLG